MRRYWLASLLVVAVLALAAGSRLGVGRSPLYATPGAPSGALRFPANFTWGVAIAGQQAESQQPSDWTEFERDVFAQGRFGTGPEPGIAKPGHIHNLDHWSETVRREKTGFERLYPADFAMAKNMGLNGFRLSIEWARLFPRPHMTDPDPEGVAFYKRLLAELKRNGLTPFVTLFHYTAPAWFFQPDETGKKGWERQDALQQWRQFVSAVADNFIPDVSQWCTLNEPMVYLYSGYMEGTYPPLEQRADLSDAADIVEALLRAHAIAYSILHQVAAAKGAEVNVGITENTLAFEPLRDWNPLDRLTAQITDQAWNWDFLDAIETGRLKLTGTGIDKPIDGLKGSEDYVGINYYSRTYVKANLAHPTRPEVLLHDPAASNEPFNDLGWASYPHGFYLILTKADRLYHKPIYILENGTADGDANDIRRQKFLVAHIREVWLAINEGKADIRSYIHWSLFDNFEWAEGFDAQFGLVAVDYENDFKRAPRPSAALYADIAQHNALSEGAIAAYGQP